jgi:phosphoribosyl-AMP cyclohydrolase
MKEENLFKIIKFNNEGLIPVVVQDFKSNEVLMVAFMNNDSLQKTLKDKLACYFSRSRNKLWQKGEKSGQFQEIKEIMIDCDGDSLLLKVKQMGKPVGVACHTGRKSCFFRQVNYNGDLTINQEVLINKEELYGKK